DWLTHAGESLKEKMKEYESFFNDFNTSMRSNEQEVTNTLNANTENIKSEVKKLENQIIETATRLLTSYQIFLNNAKESANNQITQNKTQATTEINEAKESAKKSNPFKRTSQRRKVSEVRERERDKTSS
ncbi:hypothetical protein V5H72_04340, partial [Helicobacter pylori]